MNVPSNCVTASWRRGFASFTCCKTLLAARACETAPIRCGLQVGDGTRPDSSTLLAPKRTVLSARVRAPCEISAVGIYYIHDLFLYGAAEYDRKKKLEHRSSSGVLKGRSLFSRGGHELASF